MNSTERALCALYNTKRNVFSAQVMLNIGRYSFPRCVAIRGRVSHQAIHCKASIRHVCLLDMDGVLIPNYDGMGRRISEHVAEVTGLDIETATRLNDTLYRTAGHTYVGLKRNFNYTLTKNEFDAKVYTPVFLEEVSNWLQDNVLAESVRASVDALRAADVPCYVLSNAPASWRQLVLAHLNLDCEAIDLRRLKPHRDALIKRQRHS